MHTGARRLTIFPAMVTLHQSGRTYDHAHHLHKGSTPQSVMTTGLSGLLPLSVCTYCSLSASSRPSSTRPNTTCRPCSHGVSATVMKNWEPAANWIESKSHMDSAL